jgi:RNA polymerase subunit RPABC4/transcription elongation factor Spt4
VEAIHHCPNCERRIDDEWIICPTCRTRLNRVCPNCSRLVGLDWSLCAWCGKDFERRPVVATSLGSLPPTREATGRIAPVSPPQASPAPSAIRTTVRPASSSTRPGRSSGSARQAGNLPASAQDPLPER